MTTVADIMHRGVISAAPHASLVAVARTMAAHRIHCVVVPGHGIVTDFELLAALHGPSDITAASLARTAPTIGDNEPVERAAQLLHEHGTTHAVVIDGRTAHVVGVLSALDLAEAITR